MHQYSGLGQDLKELHYLLKMRDTSIGEFKDLKGLQENEKEAY